MKKKVKDNRPGIRIPTAKGSIKHKSKKDYNRKEEEAQCCTEYYTCDFHKEQNRRNGYVSVWEKFGQEDED